MAKNIIYILGGIVVAGAILGAYMYPVAITPVSIGTSPINSTFSSAKFAGIVMFPTTVASATSSVTNSDANDRYIKSIDVGCETIGNSKTLLTGTGLASLTLTVATTSTGGSIFTNSNLVGQSTVTVPTSTAQFVIASSTAAGPGGNSALNNIWPAGSNLSFSFNATNTAACTVGVTYIPS